MAKTKIHGEYLDASVISGQTQVTAVGADSVLIFDATDNALKKALLSDVIETVADGDISTAKLADDAVTSAKLDTNIDIAGTFDVTGATTLDAALTVDTTTLVVDASNNRVGIGTASPSKTFHVYNTAAADVGLLESTQAYSTLSFKSSTNASTVTVGIDGAGNAAFENKLSSGDMTFVTNGSERMRIEADGKVGIGTTSPVLDLQVGSATSSVDANMFLAAGSNAYSRLYMGDATTGTGLYAGLLMYDHGNDVMQFFTSSAEKMRIDSSGKVGIGTASPTAPLHIATTTDDAYSLRLEGATNNSANYHGIGFAGESSNTKAAILFKDIAVSYARGDMLFCLNNDADQTSATDSDAVMTLKNDGSMKLHGGENSGVQELIFNNSYLSIADGSTYTLSGILNTGALVSIGHQRSNLGVTYDHCLLFAEQGTAFTILSDPSSRFAINSATTDTKTNIFVNGSHVVIQNEVGTTNLYSVAVFRFQGT